MEAKGQELQRESRKPRDYSLQGLRDGGFTGVPAPAWSGRRIEHSAF